MTGSSAWSDDCMQWTNITPASTNLDLGTQIAATNPQYCGGTAGSCAYGTAPWSCNLTIERVVNGYAHVYCNGANQGTVQLDNWFNLSTGVLASWSDTFTQCPGCNAGTHSATASTAGSGYYSVAIDVMSPQSIPGGLLGSGPFQFTPYSVVFSGTPNTNTAVTSSSPLDTCPSSGIAYIQTQLNALPANNCMTVYSPLLASQSPISAEAAWWPCPSPMSSSWSCMLKFQPGMMLVTTADVTGATDEDMMVITSTSVASSNCGGTSPCYQLVLARGMNTSAPAVGPQAHTNGWGLRECPILAIRSPSVDATMSKAVTLELEFYTRSAIAAWPANRFLRTCSTPTRTTA